jgi:hypothetical protein
VVAVVAVKLALVVLETLQAVEAVIVLAGLT